MESQDHTAKYIGRFAPSPTGDLHFGSLVAAIASYLQARKSAGKWFIRVEDIDPPREVPGSSERILQELSRFGMCSDDAPLYQSHRTPAYKDACETLLAEGRAFRCACSRKDLPDSGIYPGTCRNGILAGKSARSIRLKVENTAIQFTDRVQGDIKDTLDNTSGDFVIWRADDLPAYQLAVVVDDAFQGITEVVRGVDMLDSTTRQIYLQSCLGLPAPAYAHHPLATQADGSKLSKRHGSDPVNTAPAAEVARLALDFLGQLPPMGLGLQELMKWAVAEWKLERVPRRPAIRAPYLTV
jgi:glutamyl-Q tRNA(Asp) synthetase